MPKEIASQLKRNSDGLVCAVVQDDLSNEVLMVAWMDDEALARTLRDGTVTYWSRSRQEYWHKGDTSGHYQYVKSVSIDCDGDALLLRVEQIGAACHTGTHSCFEAGGALPATVKAPDESSASTPVYTSALEGLKAHCHTNSIPTDPVQGYKTQSECFSKESSQESYHEETIRAPKLQWGQTWPQLPQFCSLGDTHRVVPVVRKFLADTHTALGLYQRLCQGRPGTFLLESAHSDGSWNRWSYIGVNSQAMLYGIQGQAHWSGDVPEGLPTQGSVMDVVDDTLRQLHTPTIEGLPPLTSALVGHMGWAITQQWEPSVGEQPPADSTIPDAALCLVNDVVAFDHQDCSVWLVANAINTNNTPDGIEEAYERCLQRLDDLEQLLCEDNYQGHEVAVLTQACTSSSEKRKADISASMTENEFSELVARCQQHIYEGDVFQIVPSVQFSLECTDGFDVYRALRTINPSPYMYFFRFAAPTASPDRSSDTYDIVGASPETLMRINDSHISTFPIAGSRPRGATVEEDLALAQELLADPKECCEHVMLVDLSRNDLSKVALPGSVKVKNYMAIKRFSHIMHITSTVVAQLDPRFSPIDCLKATFPAGTLSGAPKLEAVRLLNSYEPIARGTYGGVVGYFDFSGNADMAIAIRTAFIESGRARIQAGAGIVADSVAQREYEEACNKAKAMIRAVERASMMTDRKLGE